MRILVTGSTGLVGRALRAQFAADTSCQPVYCSRKPSGATNEYTAPDMATASVADWAPIVAGADVVVHLAAALPWGPDNSLDYLRKVNVDGTGTLAAACRAAGVSRFVFVSTLGVNGIICGAQPFRPDDAPDPSGAYAQTKYEAEQMLQADDGPMPCIVIRPPVVYGAGVGGKLGAINKRIAQGGSFPFGRLDMNRRQMISSDNLADLIRRVCHLEESPPLPLLPADAEAVSTAELIRRLGEAWGRPSKMMAVPAGIFRLAARLPVIGGGVQRLIGDVRVEDSYIAETLHWTPPLTLDEGLLKMARNEV